MYLLLACVLFLVRVRVRVRVRIRVRVKVHVHVHRYFPQVFQVFFFLGETHQTHTLDHHNRA